MPINATIAWTSIATVSLPGNSLKSTALWQGAASRRALAPRPLPPRAGECIPNKPSIHTGCADDVYIGQHVGFMAIIIDEEVVDDCEAANYVPCTALASVLYAHVGCVPSVEFLKVPTSNVGLEELLLDGVVVDGQAPLLVNS